MAISPLFKQATEERALQLTTAMTPRAHVAAVVYVTGPSKL